ncbi:P-loop containing nucleoside triphosphate hydrolase protein, partial [Dunaliella salina]
DGRRILDPYLNCVRVLQPPNDAWLQSDPYLVALLAQETTSAGHSVLVFCNSRSVCESVATNLARHLGVIPETPREGHKRPRDGSEEDLASVSGTRDRIVEDLRQIQSSNVGAHYTLEELMPKGIAFHHAGLAEEEKHLVEHAFNCGAVSVLCCTPTLSLGVNLPARRVIFYKPYIPTLSHPIESCHYRQMAGRAGRAGIDDAGESILVAQPQISQYSASSLAKLIRDAPAPITTCLAEGKRGMSRAMLEAIATGSVSQVGDVKKFIMSTLLCATDGFEAAAHATRTALQSLLQRQDGFIQ